MSERALEFVELWVSEKIEQDGLPADGAKSPAKQWAAECVEAAGEEGIPEGEIEEAFDSLEEFIDGEIEEAKDREDDEEDEDDGEEFNGDDEDEDDDEEEDE